jgi:hypothetical protein
MTWFGLDDLPWCQQAMATEAVEDTLESLCDRIEILRERNETIEAHDSLYNCKRIGTLTLADLLFQQQDISKSVARRAQICIDRIRTFGADNPNALEVVWSGRCWQAPTVAWVHARCVARQPTACITVSVAPRRSSVQVETQSVQQAIHFVADETTHLEFFRTLADSPHCNEREFESLAPHAFPNAAFADGVFSGLRDLSRPFRDRRSEIVHVLATLSDHAATIFADPRETSIRAALKRRGIEASTETRETLRDAKCRAARERRFASGTLIFSWHVKIEPHIDRIYFHPPTSESGGRPVVGVIHEHLRLP